MLAKWGLNERTGHSDTESDASPTRFDIEAGQRHASPWSEEKRQQHQTENARAQVELFEAQLRDKDGTDKQRRARLHYEAARLYESPLHEFEAAAKHYELSVKLQPGHLPAVRGARRVLLMLGKHKAACRYFDAERDLLAQPERKAALLYEKSQVLAGPLASKQEAREALREALEYSKADLTVIKAAILAEEQVANWERVSDLSRAAANLEAESPKERAALLAQSARVAAVHLKDVTTAIELYKSALELDPRAPGALAALKELLYAAGRFKELVALLHQEAEWAHAAEVKASCWFRAGRLLYERLDDVPAAASALERANQVAPTDRTILDELLRIYELSGDHSRIVSAAERIVAITQPPPLDLLHRLAELYEEHLNEPERAIERLVAALQVDPAYRPALLALGRLREQRGEWRELAEMLNAEAEASSDPDHRSALHARMAEICETRLSSEEFAVEHHKQALALRPGYETSYKALVRLHSAAGRWHELIELHERQLETTTTKEERLATLFSIGRLQEEALGQPRAAIPTYRRILEEDSSSLEGLSALQRAAERAAAYTVLVEALDLEVKQTDHKPRVVTLKHRAAVLLDEKLGETVQAIERLEDILRLEKAHLPTIESLQRLYYRDGRYKELLQTYERELEVTKVGAKKAALLIKMGELCHRKLGQREEAAALYRRALQAEEGNPAAMHHLRLLLSELGEYAEVAKLLSQEAEAGDSGKAKARLWLLAGELYEHRLNAPEKALAAYRKALHQDAQFRLAIEGALRILSYSQDFKRLEEELAGEVERQSDPAYARDAAFRRAEVLRDRLAQNDEAASCLQSVLQGEKDHVGALLGLERLYAGKDDAHAGLALVLEQQVESFASVRARVAALRALHYSAERAGALDAERAKQLNGSLLSLAPNDLGALHGLEAAAIESNDYMLLSQVDAKLAVAESDRSATAAHQTRLAEAMEARGDHSAIEVYRAALMHDPENLAAARGISRIAERAGTPELLAVAAETEAELLNRPGEAARLLVLAASRLAAANSLDGAAALLFRALQIEPNDKHAAEALSSLVARGVSVKSAIDVLSQAAQAATSRQRRAALWAAVAQHQAALRDWGAAVASAKRAIREQPNSVESHVLLAQLHATSRKWQDCVNVLQDLLKLNPAEDVRFDASLQMAFIQHEHLKATTIAASNVSASLAIRPDSREATSLLLRIQLARDDLRKASETAARLVELSTTADEKAEAWQQSARVEHQRGDHERATQAYQQALAILGPKGRIGRDFREFLEALGKAADWRAYVNGWQEYLRSSSVDAEAERSIRQEIGRVLYDKLGSRDDGISALTEALRLNPGDYTLRRELSERLENAGHHEAAAEQLLLLIQAAPQTLSFWRSLSRCYAGLRQEERARMSLAPLVAAGEASIEERGTYEAGASQPAALRPDSVGERDLHAVQFEAPVQGPAVDVLAALQPALPKLSPVNWEAYGITARDRLTGGGGTVASVAREVAAALGVSEFELYLHRSKREGVSLETTDVPALFVNEEMASLPRVEQVFWLAQALGHIALGTHVVAMMPAHEVVLLLACATRAHWPGFGDELGDAPALDAHARRISKAMPWFKGNRLEPAARQLAAAGLDLKAWVDNARIVSARVGGLMCDDLAVALRLGALAGVDESFVQRVARFHISETAVGMRRRVFG